jgi:DNA-binding CsgD family transcriptional regulator
VSAAVPPGCPLSCRQLQVLQLAPDGLTYAEIGRRLDIRVSTVRTHVMAACTRLGMTGRGQVQAIITCARRGWLDWTLPPPIDEATAVNGFLRTYLESFDEHLRTGSDASRRSMRIALFGAQHGRGIKPTRWRPADDPLERICAALGVGEGSDRRAA